MYVKNLDASGPAALEAEWEAAPLHTLARDRHEIAGAPLY